MAVETSDPPRENSTCPKLEKRGGWDARVMAVVFPLQFRF